MDLPIPEILANAAGVAVVMYFMTQRVNYLLDEMKILREDAKKYRDRYEALLRELAQLPEPESITHRFRPPADINPQEYARTHQGAD